MKKFYSHLVEFESILIELDDLDITDKQRFHLAGLIDTSLHHTILDAVLSELSESDKKEFLRHLTSGEDDKIWELLDTKVDQIEDKIKDAADKLKTEIKKDIKEAKNKP